MAARFYSVVALRSLWGYNSLTGFPAATLCIIHAENQDTNITVDTVELSYIWRRSRASGDNTLQPHFHICQIGFEAGRGPWIRFHCTHSHPLGPVARYGSTYTDFLVAGIRRLTSLRPSLLPPGRLLEASGPKPTA